MSQQTPQNLNTIDAVIEALLTYFTLSAASNVDDSISHIQVNNALSLLALKDELLQEYRIPQTVREFQQNAWNPQVKAELKRRLTEELVRHQAFQENTDSPITIKGGVKADRGSVAAGEVSGEVTINNTVDQPAPSGKQETEGYESFDFSAPGTTQPLGETDLQAEDSGRPMPMAAPEKRSWLPDLSGIFTGLFGKEQKAESKPLVQPQKTLPVEFLALTAQGNAPGAACIVDIWACLSGQSLEVREKAALTGLDAVMGMKAGLSIASGSLLTVTLEIRDMSVLEPIGVIQWQGEPSNASFIVDVPAQARAGKYPGKAIISHAGIPVATLRFLFPVSAEEAMGETQSGGEMIYPRSAFASYASENREDVMERIQGMKTIAPDMDIFLDVVSLRHGQRWLDQLKQNISSRDVFYLFWSQEASQSEWVEKEWRLALAQKGLQYIDPVPLDEPDSVPPPPELSALHFNDAWLAYIKYQQMKDKVGAEARS